MKGRKLKTFDINELKRFEVDWFHGMMTLGPTQTRVVGNVIMHAQVTTSLGAVFDPWRPFDYKDKP